MIGLPAQQAAFTEVYRRDRTRLVRLAYTICGEQRQAEDAVAEAVARVWPRFRDGRIADAAVYLRRAVVNEAVSQGRRRTAGLRALARERPQGFIPAVDELVEHQQLVLQGLLRLPAAQRAAIALRFLEGLSEAETAATLDVSLGTVKSRVHRGLAALRQGLEEVGADG
jgi:RNA polymerase sigma factor (sigma-70 family)